MKFLADENVEQEIVAGLRGDGHTVISVADMAPGVLDAVVLDAANAAGAMLLTADKDFGEIVFRQGRVAAGVVLIRLGGLSSETKTRLTIEAIRLHGSKLACAFVVVSPGYVRVRRLPGG